MRCNYISFIKTEQSALKSYSFVVALCSNSTLTIIKKYEYLLSILQKSAEYRK